MLPVGVRITQKKENAIRSESIMSNSTTNNGGRVEAAQDAVVKVLVLGDAATGKTSIIKRYVHNVFSEHHKTTIGVDFALKPVTVQNTTLRLQLWDIAGQEHFRALNRVYYKDALGALVVYDLSRQDTFESVVVLCAVEERNRYQSRVAQPQAADLAGEVDHEFMNDFCETNGFAGWFATSAKDNKNIDEANKALVAAVLQHRDIFEKKVDPRKDVFRATAADSASKQGNARSSYCCSSF
ncbi:hypothetical protein B5M09_008327 [Aphanomyces astaci]|uniref:Ras-related protein Rab n=1 Tax=Aphanomyces astaci TaxID=112090 RepID=A0A3R7WQ86_APHAT|nr:hypothetical protein B5M09_008327 [Aphanomyces astaci]